MAGAHKAPAGLAVGPRPAALSGAAGCYQPGGGVRGWENSWQRGTWDIVGRLSSGGASCFVQFSVR